MKKSELRTIIREIIEKELINEAAPIVLPRGEVIVLKAEDKDYDRGLLVKLLDKGGYNISYWYGDPGKVYPAEIEVDGKSIKKDSKLVHIGLHPELKNDD